MKIENVKLHGWEGAVRGMRNPMNSWDKSDSIFGDDSGVILGPNDLRLAKTLSHAGPDHGKVLRFISVVMDINAPLYWWKEFDTYKVGTVANSCSTMHKIHAKPFSMDDFSHDHLNPFFLRSLMDTVEHLNLARDNFLSTSDKDYWWQMIQLLPSSYNQIRTVSLNYAVLKAMYHARKNHKLDEWHVFCDWIETLPYAKELIIGD